MPERDFDSIYNDYSRLVYWAAYRVLSDRELTEDVTQNVFITVLKNMDTAAKLPDAQLKGWLYRVSTNAALDMKRRMGHEVLSDEPVGAEVADNSATPEDEVLRSQAAEAVRGALAAIDETYREPLMMYYYSDMSITEISEALSVSEGTVKSRMSRGRKLLAKHLRAKGIDYE
ncbi:MAG: RNA polymerase sigma factor [Clostridia bacterium]|nr:RNA polymerase sigma factor [Clostridia bacterium]MBQ2517556.1 RNA polymerase sigma factor [Clostridia bacterium]MBQ4341800.1 RNA polymerase sigma factor [Clostridia bacterium]MBR6428572.1 RNA polymerase sigma factor [Clostridia bacterium]